MAQYLLRRHQITVGSKKAGPKELLDYAADGRQSKIIKRYVFYRCSSEQNAFLSHKRSKKSCLSLSMNSKKKLHELPLWVERVNSVDIRIGICGLGQKRPLG